MTKLSARLSACRIPALALAVALAGTLALPPAGLAADRGQQQGQRHDQPRPAQRHDRGEARHERPEFSADQSGYVRDYYRHNKWEGRRLPHGTRIVVGRRLPPGIYKRSLPKAYAYRFPHYRGYETYVVGDDIVLIAIATGIVVDILVHVH